MLKKMLIVRLRVYNADTGEVLELGGVNIPKSIQTATELPNIASSEPLEVTLLLTFYGGQAQLADLKDYFEDNLIGFEVL